MKSEIVIDKYKELGRDVIRASEGFECKFFWDGELGQALHDLRQLALAKKERDAPNRRTPQAIMDMSRQPLDHLAEGHVWVQVGDRDWVCTRCDRKAYLPRGHTYAG